MGIRTGFIQTADLRVHERTRGTGAPVVFLHGFPQTGHQWRHQLHAVSEAGYAGFAPDNRGFGLTDKPGARVSRWLLAQDVVNYLDAHDIATCTLVGHDWGGIIAFKTAIDHPDRITKLVLIDTLCTVWSPQGPHGWWFKVPGLAETFFERHDRDFIEVMFAGADASVLGQRPDSPWGRIPPGPRPRPDWIDDEALAHYVEAFSDPLSWWHAISYYRDALPFHEVLPDGDRATGERYVALDARRVSEFWLHPEGMEQHPEWPAFSDYGPEDRHKRYPHPVLWLYGGYLGGSLEQGKTKIPAGNPFLDQFGRYFPDLRARSVAGAHFLGEECPAYVNECLLAFLSGVNEEIS
jgi:pimeloyl-ACP methyl ester carboxylesterase